VYRLNQSLASGVLGSVRISLPASAALRPSKRGVARADNRDGALWSPVVATGGNQPQTHRAHRRRIQAKTVAVGCHPLPETFHGKEGIDGSSPSEGLNTCKTAFLMTIESLQSKEG
jgi:hypothetical protein